MSNDDLLLALVLAGVGFLVANPLLTGGLAVAVGAPYVAGQTSRKYQDLVGSGVPPVVADLFGWASLLTPFPGPAGTQRILDWLRGFK